MFSFNFYVTIKKHGLGPKILCVFIVIGLILTMNKIGADRTLEIMNSRIFRLSSLEFVGATLQLHRTEKSVLEIHRRSTAV